jgi:hypothetical protein
VLLDRAGDRLVDNDQDYWVEVTGTRSEIEELGGAVRGILRVEQPDWEGGPVPIERIRWEDEGGLDYAWKIGTPALVVQRYESRSFQLTPAAVAIDESRLNPRLALARDQLRFEPSAAVQVSGPKTSSTSWGASSSCAWRRSAARPRTTSSCAAVPSCTRTSWNASSCSRPRSPWWFPSIPSRARSAP